VVNDQHENVVDDGQASTDPVYEAITSERIAHFILGCVQDDGSVLSPQQ
jgi:hypothetical protein